jgi:hypothetical protein
MKQALEGSTSPSGAGAGKESDHLHPVTTFENTDMHMVQLNPELERDSSW